MKTETETWEKCYGINGFSPIARNYPYSHYVDFGAVRSYGFLELILETISVPGRTPIIAVEGGVIEALGWIQYGGWRIGIRSFDSKKILLLCPSPQRFPLPQRPGRRFKP